VVGTLWSFCQRAPVKSGNQPTVHPILSPHNTLQFAPRVLPSPPMVVPSPPHSAPAPSPPRGDLHSSTTSTRWKGKEVTPAFQFQALLRLIPRPRFSLPQTVRSAAIVASRAPLNRPRRTLPVRRAAALPYLSRLAVVLVTTIRRAIDRGGPSLRHRGRGTWPSSSQRRGRCGGSGGQNQRTISTPTAGTRECALCHGLSAPARSRRQRQARGSALSAPLCSRPSSNFCYSGIIPCKALNRSSETSLIQFQIGASGRSARILRLSY
jgi:hypothetical protein